MSPIPQTGLLDIAVYIGKARKNFIERIEIVNNVRTLDSVIRREFEIIEGDAFNQLKLDRSIRNVRNLGFFSDVSVRNIVGSFRRADDHRADGRGTVTGEFSVGVGYSSP